VLNTEEGTRNGSTSLTEFCVALHKAYDYAIIIQISKNIVAYGPLLGNE
jgi:hypothetical protein